MKKELREDKKAKTKAFFFKKESSVFNKKLINFLKSYYKKNKKDIRICMHRDSSDQHHDMVLLQKKKIFINLGTKTEKWGPSRISI